MKRHIQSAILGCFIALCQGAAYAGPPVIELRGVHPSEAAPHRQGNVYAPEVHRHGDRLRMWYGGQGLNGHDRIHLAESTDGVTWEKQGVVIDNGTFNNVNDPRVVCLEDI